MFDQSVHDEIKRKNNRFAICVSVIVVAFAAVRMLLIRFFIDPDIHFYTDNAGVFAPSFDYAVAACVVAIYIASLFIYKHKRESHSYTEVADCFVQGTQTLVFSASLTGFLFVANSVFQAYSFIRPGISGGLPLNEHLYEYIKLYPFDFIIFFIAILSAVYFFKTAALNFDIGESVSPVYQNGDDGNNDTQHKYSSAHIMLSFMPIVWSFLNVFKCFFDMSKSVNSPVRIYELMSYLALSVYFVSESGMLAGRREVSRFFTFSYISAIITAVSSLPNLIWSSFWIFKPNNNNDQIFYAVELALVIYILSRIYSQIKYGRFSLRE